MKSIEITSHVGSDGILHLDLPTDYANQDVELVLVIQAKTEQKQWPSGFFEETYGCLADDPIERGEQGKCDVRDSIE